MCRKKNMVTFNLAMISYRFFNHFSTTTKSKNLPIIKFEKKQKKDFFFLHLKDEFHDFFFFFNFKLFLLKFLMCVFSLGFSKMFDFIFLFFFTKKCSFSSLMSGIINFVSFFIIKFTYTHLSNVIFFNVFSSFSVLFFSFFFLSAKDAILILPILILNQSLIGFSFYLVE